MAADVTRSLLNDSGAAPNMKRFMFMTTTAEMMQNRIWKNISSSTIMGGRIHGLTRKR